MQNCFCRGQNVTLAALSCLHPRQPLWSSELYCDDVVKLRRKIWVLLWHCVARTWPLLSWISTLDIYTRLDHLCTGLDIYIVVDYPSSSDQQVMRLGLHPPPGTLSPRHNCNVSRVTLRHTPRDTSGHCRDWDVSISQYIDLQKIKFKEKCNVFSWHCKKRDIVASTLTRYLFLRGISWYLRQFQDAGYL